MEMAEDPAVQNQHYTISNILSRLKNLRPDNVELGRLKQICFLRYGEVWFLFGLEKYSLANEP